MQPDDIRAVAEVAANAFGRPITDESAARGWSARVAYPLGTDPDGAFVAEVDGRIIGAAEAIVRERLWVLSLLVVGPDIQSAGVGRALLAPAVAYREPTDAGLIVGSNDPRALRLYADHGFALHPTFRADGEVARRVLPPTHAAIREDATADDLESLAPLTRTVRGAPYTAEFDYVLERGGRLIRLGDRGFAVLEDDGGLWLLVARDEEAARALLWFALAAAEGPARVRWITGAQQWAIDVLVKARLEVIAYGGLCVRGDPGSLRPFLPTPAFA
jgi:GNAT superfamily N-acetyltransferase